MTACRNQRGAALVAVLSIAMILLPLGAFVVFQCHTDFAIQRNLRREIETFYVAEAGLNHAIAEIPSGGSFDEILVGPDHVAGTPDDGWFPFMEAPPANFPVPPFRYEVHVQEGGSGAIRIISRGLGAAGATKVVAALVTRSQFPSTPGALYAGGDLRKLDLGSGDLRVSGLDHRVGDAGMQATGTAPPLPALSSPRADAARTLRRRLSGIHSRQLIGAGASPSIGITAPLELRAYAAGFGSSPRAVRLTAKAVTERAVGTEAAPQITIVDGDLDVPHSLKGSGVLVVQGTLHVSGTVTFQGLLLALGGVVFESSSEVTVLGTVWNAANQDERLTLRGRGAILYSSTALASVDAAFPGLLPHAAVVVGWEEQL
ncbi:MAG: hypothetical protein ACE5I7_12295 [Candidatus Binatia bacterium]